MNGRTMGLDTPVIKASEMALEADGRYVGEIGNPSYAPLSELLLFEPAAGALLNTRGRQAVDLPSTALVAIPHHLGHVTLGEFCAGHSGPDGSAVMSERDFEARLATLCQAVRPKFQMICRLEKALGGRLTEYDMEDAAIRLAHREDPHYSPRLLLETAVSLCTRDTNVPLLEPLSYIGFFDLANTDIGTQSIAFFYHFHRHHTEYRKNSAAREYTSREAQLESLHAYPWRVALLDEFHQKPDGRFGDALLDTCSQYCRET